MKISQVEERLKQLKQENGDLDVKFCNYLEETVIANVTDINLAKGSIMIMCTDGGEITEEEDSEFANYATEEDIDRTNAMAARHST